MLRWFDTSMICIAGSARRANSLRRGRRSDVGRRYRSIVQGSHVIFYRVTVKEAVIVHVLHGRMRAARHLPK